MTTHASFYALVIAILAIGFLSASFRGIEISGRAVQTGVTIDDLSCNWAGESYRACMKIDWSSDDVLYAKPFFSGGQPLSAVQPFYTPSTYCDYVGAAEGIRSGGVYLYGESDRVLSVKKDVSVNCARKQSSSSTFSKHLVFSSWRTGPNSQSTRGTETVEVPLPRPPSSCELNGRWKTDNTVDDKTNRRRNTRTRGYCHGYEGAFSSFVNANDQEVTSDPASFRLAGTANQLIDLLPYRLPGYVIHAWLCDSSWFLHDRDKRYYVRAYVPDFGKEPALKLRLEYYNDDSQPLVDFEVDVTCQLQAPPSEPVVRKAITAPASEASLPEETSAIEAFELDEAAVSPEPSVESPAFTVRPVSFFGRLSRALQGFAGGWRGA